MKFGDVESPQPNDTNQALIKTNKMVKQNKKDPRILNSYNVFELSPEISAPTTWQKKMADPF